MRPTSMTCQNIVVIVNYEPTKIAAPAPASFARGAVGPSFVASRDRNRSDGDLLDASVSKNAIGKCREFGFSLSA
jgi:hypothetical protein